MGEGGTREGGDMGEGGTRGALRRVDHIDRVFDPCLFEFVRVL